MDRGFSHISLSNLELIEELYEKFKEDKDSIDPSWIHFFTGWEMALSLSEEPREKGGDLKVFRLIEAFRKKGHLIAGFNPLIDRKEIDELKMKSYDLQESDLEKLFPTDGLLKEPQAALKTIMDTLLKTYSRSIGIEYMHLSNLEIRRFLQERIEPYFLIDLTREEKLSILTSLNKAELFEAFLHTKYVGQKRFSLEGAETLIPMIGHLLEKGSLMGIRELVIGTSHRGRLNLLCNILGKSYQMIFHEFEDHYTPDLEEGTGDVKYHKGFTGEYKARSNKEIQVTLTANPSHLESVDPVVEGIVRAKQDREGGKKDIVPLLIHGDAAVSGQGVVYETLQLASLEGYKTGGTIHIVINNQIGFTATSEESRSTHYCTDIAKGFDLPVFHVNAEDPEGCAYAIGLAVEIRQRFGIDVFIDLNCYRKYGHNESDEPMFTQPILYHQIKNKEIIPNIYAKRLIEEGLIDQSDADRVAKEFKEELAQVLKEVKTSTPKPITTIEEDLPLLEFKKPSIEQLKGFLPLLFHCPEGFSLHPKLKMLFEKRLSMFDAPNQKTVDWAVAEQLAFASLLNEGVWIRLTGQDSGRGTFSHRQAILHDQKNGEAFIPLAHISDSGSLFSLYNSPLSEFAALGFEFGYSLVFDKSLTIWEAQFGDFSNGAQIIIDQYIASSYQKWGLHSSIVLYLPHGYEGQGPEHSSARIERFLQLAAQNNMHIVQPSTSFQLYHLLRLQALNPLKKPLIIFTPKALLRFTDSFAKPADLTGRFHEILFDERPIEKPKKIVFCSGKIFYELKKKRDELDAPLLLIRLEQLYPFPKEALSRLPVYDAEYIWMQEEHENMGAYQYIKPHLEELYNKKLSYIGRPSYASVAAGSYQLHKKQYDAYMEEAFTFN